MENKQALARGKVRWPLNAGSGADGEPDLPCFAYRPWDKSRIIETRLEYAHAVAFYAKEKKNSCAEDLDLGAAPLQQLPDSSIVETLDACNPSTV